MKKGLEHLAKTNKNSKNISNVSFCFHSAELFLFPSFQLLLGMLKNVILMTAASDKGWITEICLCSSVHAKTSQSRPSCQLPVPIRRRNLQPLVVQRRDAKDNMIWWWINTKLISTTTDRMVEQIRLFLVPFYLLYRGFHCFTLTNSGDVERSRRVVLMDGVRVRN